MAQDECAPFRENIPAYALGALDVDEAVALEAHLRTCDSCSAELASYQTIGDVLLTAVPPKQPPAQLRQRLQERLPSAQKPRRQLWPSFSFGQLAMAAVLVLLVALNVFSLIQLQSLQR